MIAIVVLQAGVSRAMTLPSCRVDDGLQGEEIWKGVKQTVTDPATGLVVRVEQDVPGHLTVDVADKAVSIHKDLRGSTSTTTLSDGRRQLSFSFDGRDLVVRGLKNDLRGSIANTESLMPVLRQLKDSALVQSAKGVLDRMALQADRAEGNALLLTRALLGSVVGETSSVEQYQRWARHTLTQPGVIRVGQTRGPGQCWDEYSREALRIFDEYGGCVASCRWYEPFCAEGCEAIYTLRAEMAFMWYFNCNGPFYAG